MAFTTRLSLLSRIREGDGIGWEEFYMTYRPLILLQGGDYFLTESEREELVQETLLAVFKEQKRFKYDPKRGKFRTYLKTIIRNRAIDIKRKRNKRLVSEADIDLENLTPEEETELDRKWDAEWYSHSLRIATEELRNRLEPKTYQAFEFYVLEKWEPKEVADFLDISLSSVYVAKNRAVAKLKTIIKELELM